MDIHALLKVNCDKLLEQYHANLRDVRALQETLINDILPSVSDELHLGDSETNWAKEWLSDTCQSNWFRPFKTIKILI